MCQRALEMTLEYVKERKQFGVPVGSFQAMSPTAARRCCCDTESARSTAYYAAWSAGRGALAAGRGGGAGRGDAAATGGA